MASVALFVPGHKDGEFVMFVRPRDRERETWTGRRAGVEGVMLDYGADKAYVIDELDRVLPRYLAGVERVYYPLGNNERMNSRLLELIRGAQAMRPRTGSGPVAMLDPRELIHEARLKKRPEEIDAMRRAVAISCEAHKDAMRRARGGMMEWEIEALVDYTFRSRGAAGPSYPSIIASGPNAATLHYIHNDRKMMSGMMQMMSQSEEEYAAAIKANGVLEVDGNDATLTVKKTTKDKNGSNTETMTQKYKIQGNQCLITH